MHSIIIKGGQKLEGVIEISGSKNDALPKMLACLLTEEEIILHNLPKIKDVEIMNALLTSCGVKIKNLGGKSQSFQADKISNFTASYEIASKMRASNWILGPLLARFGRANIYYPGGCKIGARGIELHLMALEQMGVEINVKDEYIEAKVNHRLKGAEINFNKVSVGLTHTILMAASLAEGITIINNAACEPEIVELCNLLKSMGAKIKNIGSNRLVIEGVEKLHKAESKICFDRIEAGTYMIAAAMNPGNLRLRNIDLNNMEIFVNLLEQSGCKISQENGMTIVEHNDKIQPVNMTTSVYPGFPTDLQSPYMTYMSLAQGKSVIKEKIFENRFMHVEELNKMGAHIEIEDDQALIIGVEKLLGKSVKVTDLRAGAALILAGLVAEGETILTEVHHIHRGYEDFITKLTDCGADIKII